MLSLKDISNSYRGHYSYYRNRPDEDFGAGPLNPLLSFVCAASDAFVDVLDGEIDSSYHFYEPDQKKEARDRKPSPDSAIAKQQAGITVAQPRVGHIRRRRPSEPQVEAKKTGISVMPTSDGKISIQTSSGNWLKVDGISEMSEGFHVVKKEGKFNYMNKDGELLAKNWLDSASMFKDGVAKIRLGNAKMEINKEGTILKKTSKAAQEIQKGMKI